jgi:hypothetical protein
MFQIAVPFLFGIGWGIAQENPSGSKGTGFSPYIKEAGTMGFYPLRAAFGPRGAEKYSLRA